MEPLFVTLVAGRYRDGGVEQQMNRLAAGFLEQGVNCTFLLGERGAKGAAESIPTGVEVKCVGAEHGGFGDEVESLVSQRSAERHVVLIFRTSDYTPVVRAARANRSHRPGIFLVTGMHLRERLDPRRVGRLRAWKLRYRMRRYWSQADAVIAVSPDTADDWRSVGPLPADRVWHVRPPVVGPDVDAKASESIPHDWGGGDAKANVILGVGRLSADKRFHLILEAVRQLRDQRNLRVVIVGDGPEKEALHEFARHAGVADITHFTGFTSNPYAWMKHADVLVLPSRQETFGLVLIESLYAGTPFVSTREARGPVSIHEATGCGRLVAEANGPSLARAINEELSTSVDPQRLRQAAEMYDSSASAREYLSVISKHFLVHQ